jgi:general secretion pathway protein I
MRAWTRHARGFSLLEIMVAVAILGLALTVILSAQVGLFSSGTYTQHVSEAIGLGRCKMTELEEQFLKLGYPEVDSNDEGACCVGETRPDFSCAWKIERIELPNPPPFDPSGLSAANPAGSGGLSLGGPSGAPPTGMGAIGALAGVATGLDTDGGLGGLAQAGLSSGTSGLSGMLSGGAASGVGALAPVLMGMVYPSIKPMLEASIRKVTVTVLWREGLAKRELEILQWVTNPSKGGFITATGDSADPAASGAPGARPAGGLPGGLGGLPGGLPGGLSGAIPGLGSIPGLSR